MNDQKLDLILQKLESLESGQAELQQITSAIRDRQEETDAKLEALSMDVHQLHGVVVAIKENIDELNKSQQRQDKILETLAVRSLEQETDIRHLKAN
ncbi:hypothetical protein DMN77_18870 [Paenibacillus sp. 79R4]|uniref:hypothetical protein n=1 Tax=Paenibacillus sp. 79R4 TaxID=2212847 RepID=UPI0015B7ED08|nr:hypothetical protein [Paenibacillus sp. 79R4]NWL89614.1 hypothetical protein [Paenibacillus sp. 79R4]